MTPHPSPTQVLPPAVARHASLATLVLRFGVGFHLLGAGLGSYMDRAQGGGRAFAALGIPLGGGSMPFTVALPFVMIAAGVALVLGFCTTAAGLVACTLALLPSALQSFFMLVTGMPVNYAGQPFFFEQALGGWGGGLTLLAPAALVALGGRATNLYSLDALMFSGKKRRLTPAPPSSTTPAEKLA